MTDIPTRSPAPPSRRRVDADAGSSRSWFLRKGPILAFLAIVLLLTMQLSMLRLHHRDRADAAPPPPEPLASSSPIDERPWSLIERSPKDAEDEPPLAGSQARQSIGDLATVLRRNINDLHQRLNEADGGSISAAMDELTESLQRDITDLHQRLNEASGESKPNLHIRKADEDQSQSGVRGTQSHGKKSPVRGTSEAATATKSHETRQVPEKMNHSSITRNATYTSNARRSIGSSSVHAHRNDLIQYLQDGSPIGYVRIPQIPPGKRTGDDAKLHIIFSSGCNYFQHWQSELLLASAYLVGQRGRMTRIVSGCNDRKAETVQHKYHTFPSGRNDLLVPIDQLNRSVNENFGLFVTPAFEGARDFPWINKPSSIKYFLEKARPELDRLGETVIAILDPDFVFLKPLTQTGLRPGEYIATRGQEGDPGSNSEFLDVVQKGRPVAQRYGLEGGWVNPKKYNLQNITGESKPKASAWSRSDAAKWTSVGPPLMLHIDDISGLSVLWERYMHPVVAIGKDILADMRAYSISAAQLDLKHTTLDQYMISTSGSHGEAFPWVDSWTQLSCRNPTPLAEDKYPTFVHMASNFKAPNASGPWIFHKGHVPATILDCDTPLIIEAPDELWEMTEGAKGKQQAWVLCHIVSKLNKVLLMYKQRFCPVGFEQRKLVRLIQSKTVDRGCKEHSDKWCFPLAQIEGLPEDWRKDGS